MAASVPCNMSEGRRHERRTCAILTNTDDIDRTPTGPGILRNIARRSDICPTVSWFLIAGALLNVVIYETSIWVKAGSIRNGCGQLQIEMYVDDRANLGQ